MELRRPLGLVLAGGGSFGCWQVAAVAELERRGLVFDAVLGVSVGAVTAASYALNRMGETVERWRALGGQRFLRFSPRLAPLTFFSPAPLWDWVGAHVSEEKDDARCRLVVASNSLEEKRTLYSVFDRKSGRWDGPLGQHLVGSCSIPMLFPPVRTQHQGRAVTLVDGGLPGAEPFTFAELAHCKDVILVQMPGYKSRWLRKGGRNQMDEGIASLKVLPEPPRLFELNPSKRFAFEPTSFRAEDLAQGLALGAADAAAFIERGSGRSSPAGSTAA